MVFDKIIYDSLIETTLFFQKSRKSYKSRRNGIPETIKSVCPNRFLTRGGVNIRNR